MTKTNHTPEPWELTRGHAIRDVCQLDQGPNDADLRRIVACVNACQGIFTTDLERVNQKSVVLGITFDIEELDLDKMEESDL